jgi:hypothetical protein
MNYNNFINRTRNMDLVVGDEVYWNDPDNGLTSSYYKVVKIISAEVVLLKNKTSETEAFISELS